MRSAFFSWTRVCFNRNSFSSSKFITGRERLLIRISPFLFEFLYCIFLWCFDYEFVLLIKISSSLFEFFFLPIFLLSLHGLLQFPSIKKRRRKLLSLVFSSTLCVFESFEIPSFLLQVWLCLLIFLTFVVFYVYYSRASPDIVILNNIQIKFEL